VALLFQFAAQARHVFGIVQIVAVVIRRRCWPSSRSHFAAQARRSSLV
jgi:hypothetical protein